MQRRSLLAVRTAILLVGGFGSPGGAYQQAGGNLVGTNDAHPGDLIQTINAAKKNSDSPTTSGLQCSVPGSLPLPCGEER